MRDKRYIRVRDVIAIVLMAILLIAGIVLLSHRGKSSIVDLKVKKVIDTAMNFEKSDDNSDLLDRLRKVFGNKDVIAYIEVPKAGIAYPIVQGKTNTEYLKKNVYGERDIAGSIFLDCENMPDFSDSRSVVYGHHMIDNTMFGGLSDYYSSAIEGQEFTIYTRDSVKVYSILGSSKINANDRNGYIGENTQTTSEFINKLKGISVSWNDGVVYDDSSKLVTLMTCEGNGKKYRFGVTGVLKEDSVSPIADEKS